VEKYSSSTKEVDKITQRLSEIFETMNSFS